MVNSKKLCGMIGLARKAGKVILGTDACVEAIKKRKVKLVIISKGAADRTKNMFNTLCKKYNVPIHEVLETDEISSAVGKDNKVVLGINDKNFSEAIAKIINGGEVIG